VSQNSHSASCEVGRLAVDLEEYQSWKDPNDALTIMESPVLRSVHYLNSAIWFAQSLRMLFPWRLSIFHDLVIPNSTRYPFMYFFFRRHKGLRLDATASGSDACCGC